MQSSADNGSQPLSLSHSFIRAFEAWSDSQVTQSRNRSEDRMPSVDEFILMRRATIGGAMVEGLRIFHMGWQPTD